MSDNVTDIVERLRALHVWPQFVADEHADVILPRQSRGLYDVGHVAHEAANEIETLRDVLRKVRECALFSENTFAGRPPNVSWIVSQLTKLLPEIDAALASIEVKQ